MVKKHAAKYKNIGRIISEERRKKGFTQIQLAEMVGVSLSYISKIEAANCSKSFSLEVLFDICDALDIPITTVFRDIE